MPGNKARSRQRTVTADPDHEIISPASGRHGNISECNAGLQLPVIGLIFDPENKVQLLVDEELLEQEEFGCHPCVNTSSIKMKTADVF